MKAAKEARPDPHDPATWPMPTAPDPASLRLGVVGGWLAELDAFCAVFFARPLPVLPRRLSPAEWHEKFTHRAAILEYMSGWTRADAEAQAIKDIGPKPEIRT